MNTLALIGGGFLLLAGLIALAVKLGGDAREEKIRRYLAEAQARSVQEAVEAADEQRKKDEADWA